MSKQDDFVVFRYGYDAEYNMGRLRYDGPAPLTEGEALGLSITKWKFMVSVLENPHNKAPINYLHDGGAHTCGLCMYHDDDRNPCVTCVVARTTGRDACLTTPYDLYWSAPLGIYEPDEPMCDRVRLAALEAARAEVVFLESLREKLDEQERA